MSENHPNAEHWQECPPGELTQMVTRLDRSQRRARHRKLAGVVLGSSAAYAAVVLALGSWMSSQGTIFGGISCSYCVDHFEAYSEHLQSIRVSDDAEFLASMRTHIEKCALCRSKFQSRFPGVWPGASAEQAGVWLAPWPLAWQPGLSVSWSHRL